MMSKNVRRRTGKGRNRTQGVWGERERRRLLQLGVCLVLFLAVFFARGTEGFEQLREHLRQAIYADVDLREAFSALGRTLSDGGGLSLRPLDVLVTPEATQPPSARPTAEPMPTAAPSPTPEPPPPTAPPTPQPTPAATAEPEVVFMDYSGRALPDNTTMDRYSLGLSSTVAPVSGRVTSTFGWREHPIEGEERFHFGVDLKAGEGTAVGAFADGEVEYIGESDIYGLYLQLRHENGVSSFYAHCSELYVTQGEQVSAGQRVAASGATGIVTGPHLHFELKKDGVRLNPAYYLSNP